MNLRLAACLCLAASAVCAADGPVFSAASVKPGTPGPVGCTGGPGTPSPAKLTCTDATVASLIALAYEVRPNQISGPEWITRADEGFDVEAAIPAGSSGAEFRQMLRNLLAERLHLVVRQESRESTVYSLRVSRKGAKLKEGRTQIPPVLDRVLNGLILVEGRGATLNTLAAVLSRQLGTPVHDETMLPASYDFVLTYSGQDAMQLGKALEEQLGLQLASTKVATRMLVVQDALKKPSQN